MLVEFSVENFLSFGQPRTFSFLAASTKEHQDTHVFHYAYPGDSRAREIPLLKSAVVYGANASGKSNLINALDFVQDFIKNSSRETQISDSIPTKPFRLNVSARTKPSYFEIIFIQNRIRYRYGFRVDSKRVHDEWLYHAPKGKEAYLFEREGNDIKINRAFKEGKELDKKTRPNALFLSVCAQFNGEISTRILEWFDHLLILKGVEDHEALHRTFQLLESTDFKRKVMEFIEVADLGISDLTLNQIDISEDMDESFVDLLTKMAIKFGGLSEGYQEKKPTILRQDLSLSHHVFNDDNQPAGEVKFDYLNESDGTIKMISLAGPILDALLTGKILVIDELDARLHPLLTRFIINLFNSSVRNPHNAQLLFTTHDTNLLSNKLFRRDQIWFTEKNRYGVSDLYSLFDFKPVRKDAAFAKEYIQGRYGAIPFIGDIDALLADWVDHGQG